MTENKRILLVDDSSTARAFVRSALETEGFIIEEAGNGVEALECVNKSAPDVMVLDLLMPEMDGFEVLEELQKQGISLPIIVLTADVQEEVRIEVLELGAAKLLNKPQVKAQLLDTINGILG